MLLLHFLWHHIHTPTPELELKWVEFWYESDGSTVFGITFGKVQFHISP